MRRIDISYTKKDALRIVLQCIFFYAIIINLLTGLFPGTPGVLETSDD